MTLPLFSSTASLSVFAAASTDGINESEEDIYNTRKGGGYAATGQIANVGYTTQIYDATNGLPTSDANFVLGSDDGYLWIGSYGGILRYDGSTFTKMDPALGLTSGRGLFEDRHGRIWVGTNDNGVVMIDGNDTRHFTYEDGLPSSSIREFAEDDHGNIFIATTAGICYIDNSMQVISIDNSRINGKRVLRLDSDSSGVIYGHTKDGLIFKIKNKRISEVYSGDDFNIGTITSIMADPKNDGKVFICTDQSMIYYGSFGEYIERMQKISVFPINNVHWISYDCDRIWVASTSQVGFLDEDFTFHLISDLPIKSGIEMMTSDYQGNMWFASSTQGLIKLVTNRFSDIYKSAGLSSEVTNATCLYNDKLYIGTDSGLRIIDHSGRPVKNRLSATLKKARIRCIQKDYDDNLWIGTFSDNIGLICLSQDGNILSYTEKNGLVDNEIRSISATIDGNIFVSTNGGLVVINDKKIVKTVSELNRIKNTVFLTVEEGLDGIIYVGTDGDGMYAIDGFNIKKIGQKEGLTSEVVTRIKRDNKHGVLWIITSNSIEYMKDGIITPVTTFPYNYNYDLYFDSFDNMWVISSYGICIVPAKDMLKNEVSDHRLYTVENGLAGAPTSMSYSALSDDGYLYIPGRTGVYRVNIDHFSDNQGPIKTAISSIYCDDELILPNDDGSYRIGASKGRIRITPSVLDYTLANPIINVALEGPESDEITVSKSELSTIEYTGLAYGKYTLHIRVLDNNGRNVISEDTYTIEKKSMFYELPAVRLAFVLALILLTGFVVWRFLLTTVINKQYEEIRQARDEAERANTAKSRFLANISHEIRTPINTIMGMNEMVLREDATGVPKNYFISMINYSLDIRNATESLLSLINDILDMSKIESGKMHLVEQEYDTHDMLRSIVSMIRMRSNEKELIFDVTVDEILPVRLFGDFGKIKQVVLNLLTNALKYTEVGGFALLVSMDERTDDECVIRFSVKDTGIGVKEEDMDKLFSAYERLDEKKNSGIQGTGLGLDISRRFAELMNGSLTCESTYGEGSEFIFTITQRIVDPTPIGVFMEHDDSTAAGPYVPQFIAPDADILVVDDTPMNLSVIKGLLKATKVFVTTANSGEECLEKLKENHFNVVLLDHMMPGMDGIETCAKIRELYPDLPVYALTANSTSGEEFYKSKGFNGYLAKPIDSVLLEKTIMKHLPEAIMKKPEAADAVADLTEIPENLKWINETEGISVDDGIKNSGGISNFIFSLNLFLDTIEDNAKVIRDALESDNLRLYTIKVHSLKSSARITGAMELSELAAKLEEAGNNEDKAFINTYTPQLLSDYEAFIKKLSGLKEDAEGDDSDKEMIPQDELNDAYDALKEVVPQMDYDSVEMILDQLFEYKLPPKDDVKLKELNKMLKVFDWDGMEALIGQ